MTVAGPPIEVLTRRLADAPPDVLAAPRIGRSPGTDVSAVVGDVFWIVSGERVASGALNTFDATNAAQSSRLRLVCLTAWLFYDGSLRHPTLAGRMLALLRSDRLSRLAGLVDPQRFVDDPDRREELARLALSALELLPDGESEAAAADRLSALDSVERRRVLEAARQAEARAEEVRKQMAAKAAAEAAAKVSRE